MVSVLCEGEVFPLKGAGDRGGPMALVLAPVEEVSRRLRENVTIPGNPPSDSQSNMASLKNYSRDQRVSANHSWAYKI